MLGTSRPLVCLIVFLAGCAGEIDDAPPLPGARVVVEGRLQLVMVGDGVTAAPEYFLEREGQRDGRWLRLLFDERHDLLHRAAADSTDPDHDHLGLAGAARVRVDGVTVEGERLQVLGLTDVETPGGAVTAVQQALIAASPKKVAVILANFSDDPRQPVSADGARGTVFTGASSTNAYFKETSFGVRSLTGKLRADGDVFGWYTIPDASASCDYVSWGNAARTAAQNAGVDLAGYDHVVHYFPRVSACRWAGVGQVPGRYTWINGSSAATIAHELGHNFGLHHASSLACRDRSGIPAPIGTSCSANEYGDPFDVMGSGFRHFSAFHKGRLGWLEAANTATVTADGTFAVTPLETKSAGVQSLRVAIPGTTLYYYIELRQPFGFDNFSATSSVVRGVLIHRAPAYATLARPLLLDNNPSTTSFSDAALTVGNTFQDSTAGIRVTVNSVSTTGASVTIDVP
jgi:hypothetical protein